MITGPAGLAEPIACAGAYAARSQVCSAGAPWSRAGAAASFLLPTLNSDRHMNQAQRRRRDAGNAAGLAERQRAHTLQLLAHLAPQTVLRMTVPGGFSLNPVAPKGHGNSGGETEPVHHFLFPRGRGASAAPEPRRFWVIPFPGSYPAPACRRAADPSATAGRQR